MTREVVIIDSGLVCAAGNQDECWQRLLAGESALKPLGLSDLHCHVGQIRNIEEDIGSKARLVTLIRHGLRQLQPITDLAQTHLLVATTKGAADESLLDATKENHGLAWQVAGIIAGEIGPIAHQTTVSAACASGTVALIQASQMIERDEAKQVLVVGIDILSRFVLAGFTQLQALATGPCRPFDKDRNGLCLGEGIGLMLLTSKEIANQRNDTALAAMQGWGIACDANHITAPCRQASGLRSALRQATANGTRAVGAINAHGTGTIHNDAMEITAFQNIWDDTPPPFHSVKGAIGHCLGAAGVIEACLTVQALRAGEIPGTVGLVHPADFPDRLGDRRQKITSPAIISCNSGFGGINAAILLGN